MEVPLRAHRVLPLLLLSLQLTAQLSASARAAPLVREKIPDELSAKVRSKKLAALDQPIAVGTAAPRVPGLTRAPTAIIFYRGHW